MTTLGIGVCVSNVACAAVVAALAVPLIRRRVPMNPIYGARFPRSFESDEMWYRINEHAGRRLVRWSWVVALLGIPALFVTSERVLAALAFAPVLYVIAAVESWRFGTRL